MRHTSSVFLAALAITALVACGKSAPTTPAPAPKAPPAAKTGAEPDKGSAASPAAANDAPASAAPAKAAPKVADAPGKADEADMVPETKRTPEVTAEECAKACAHATKLSMASMPPDATPDMKAAIEKALNESCPKDCLAKGTKKLVACIMNAVALDLEGFEEGGHGVGRELPKVGVAAPSRLS